MLQLQLIVNLSRRGSDAFKKIINEKWIKERMLIEIHVLYRHSTCNCPAHDSS